MNFGEYLRQKRLERAWTQPEAAIKADIEQSYLSKLETGKSYPSEDVFSRIVEVYKIDVADMNRCIKSTELSKLMEIKDIRTLVVEEKKAARTLIRSWLFAGLISMVLSGACFGLYLVAPDSKHHEFYYRSTGVLLPGEALSAYWVVEESFTGDDPVFERLKLEQQVMTDRIEQKELVLGEFRGEAFVENLPEGKRLYEFVTDRVLIEPSSMRWFLVPTLMLLAGSLGCFFISTRWK